MDNQNMDSIANALLGLGIILLIASYALPAVTGFIFPESVLRGWETALLTLAAFLEFFDRGTGAIIVGLFLCHLILISGIVLYLINKAPGWYKIILVVSALYVLAFSIVSMGFKQLEIGFYAYLASFALVGSALFLRPLTDQEMSVDPDDKI